MSDVINIIDNGALVHLAQADQLDLLVAGGRRVVITAEVLEEFEATRSPALLARLESFLARNSDNIDGGVRPISQADIARFNPPQPNGDIATGQRGDVSILAHVELTSNNGAPGGKKIELSVQFPGGRGIERAVRFP